MTVDMQASHGIVLAFGPYRLLTLQRVVLRDNAPLQLGSRALEILIVLVERAGEVVEKRELLKRIWPNRVVEEATLRVHIAALRRVLGEGEEGVRYVESVVGRGYCFVAPVRELTQTQGEQLAGSEPSKNVTKGTREGRLLLAFVHVDITSMAGVQQLVELRTLPEVEEIHSITGENTMLLKVRTRDARELDIVLDRVYAIEGFTRTRSYIALSTYLERGPREVSDEERL